MNFDNTLIKDSQLTRLKPFIGLRENNTVCVGRRPVEKTTIEITAQTFFLS